VITENINQIQNEISRLCKKVNRDPSEITLVAVTKTIEIERIQRAWHSGIRHFGENRVQELRAKQDDFKHEANWHMIGHLQRNKVKYIIEKVSLIHSLDSYKLAKEIQKQARKHDKNMDVLIEINIGNEPSKFGIPLNEAITFAKNLEELPNIRLRGLMTVAPNVQDPEQVRPMMREMNRVYKELKQAKIGTDRLDVLSMGMSNDYKVAIEEGSTMIRLGSSIFGYREKGGKDV